MCTRLVNFINNYFSGVPVLGCLTESVRYYPQALALWKGFFVYACSYYCFLLDASPLRYVEKHFLLEQKVLYGTMALQLGGVIRNGVVFVIYDGELIKAVDLFPCTIEYSNALCNYIKARIPF